ncbi:MAG TPA: TetR family transcriptional regulator [Acidimicrobiales bacterium]|nr:TetR family transcriptional regulator [Acidimicrobiales bacterium]
MARWQPDAAARLLNAALELFEENGYDNTTVIAIAERAGVTKSTFFRHFPDKREVLFGGDAFARMVAEEIAAAPGTATPLEAVTAGIEKVGREAFTPQTREFSRRRRAVIAANPELQERDALKGTRISAAIAEALRTRGVPDSTALVAAHLAGLALKLAYERWSESDGEGFAELARAALRELEAAGASLS